MAISESKGTKRFRFYLQNATGGLLLLRYAPGGWESAKFEIKRNEKYLGLFRSISFNELSFRKDSRDYIRDVYESQGINAVITFTVRRLDDTTGSYLDYFVGKIDLSTYKIDETGVQVQVIDTSFHEKVKNRESVKVNIRERISVDGYEIPPFASESPEFTLPAYNIQARAAWGDRLQNSTTLENHYVPLWLNSSEFTEAQHQSCTVTIAPGNAMFENAGADYLVHLSGRVQGQCDFASSLPHVTFRMLLYVNGTLEKTWTKSGSDVNQLVFDFTVNEDFTVTTGNDFYLQGSVDHAGTTSYYPVQVDMAVTLSSVSGGPITGYPYYEAILRTLQLITDDNDVLKSDLFGRTDTPVVTYAEDGQLGHLTKGLFIRSSTGFNDGFALTLADIFQALSSVFQIGMGVEVVDGKYKVIVETLQYFFDSTVVIDLSNRIKESTIEKEVIANRHYNQVEVGYNSFEYLTVGGLAEYNTKSSFSTVIAVIDNKLDLVSKYRADTQGIVSLRKKISSTEDVKGDEDIFIVDTLRDEGDFIARTGEGFAEVTGGADAENCYNLLLTPKRNLIRHGQIIRAGLEKNLGTYLRWQATDKNTTLATRLDTETEMLVENADVLVNDLEESFFIPEIYTVECTMNYADLTTILANEKGLIKIAPEKYGWIMSLSIGQKENKVDLKLLRCNLNKVIPT